MYLRRSRADIELEQQGAGETFSRHFAMLTELSARYNIVIPNTPEYVFREIVSGDTIAEREVVKRLLKQVESGLWDGVFVTEMSRLARGDTIDQGVVHNTFLYSDTLIITPQQIYDLRDQADESKAEMDLFFARYEYRTHNRRLQTGRLNGAKSGLYEGSRRPYGYERYKLPRQKGWSLQIVEEEAAWARMIKDWYKYGIDGQIVGCETIANRLNEMGVPSTHGLPWTGDKIRALLKNPTYWGKIWWGRRVQKVDMVDGRKVKRRVPAKPAIVDGLHQAIFAEDDFFEIQDLIKSRRTSPNTVKSGCKNPFAGICKCGKCGKAMTRQICQRNSAWELLKCSTARCETSSAYISTVESAVLDVLRGWVDMFDDDMMDIEYQPDGPKTDAHSIAIAAAEKQIATLKKQLSKLRDLLEQDIYTPEVYVERQNDINGRIAAQQAIIDSMIKPSAISTEEAIRREMPRIKNVLELYQFAETPGEKNDLLKSVIGRIIYNKDEKSPPGQPGYGLSLEILPIFPK